MPEIEVEAKYIQDGCYKWTFEAKKVKAIVEELCYGKVLNLFAGKNRLNVDEVRVDKSNEWGPDYFMPAEKFLKIAIQKRMFFNTIIYDPPWNERKSKEFYEGRYIGKFTKLKDDIVKILNNNGTIISLGYAATNFGRTRRMFLTKLWTVDPKGEISPYFIAVEKKIGAIRLSNFLSGS